MRLTNPGGSEDNAAFTIARDRSEPKSALGRSLR